MADRSQNRPHINTGWYGWLFFWIAVAVAIAADFSEDPKLWRLTAILLAVAFVLGLFSDGRP